MQILKSPEAVQKQSTKWKSEGKVALVPTMGFLHEGHLSLVREAKKRADQVIVSIYVNPLQFGPNEDLDKYPRDPERDIHLLEQLGTDLLFMPTDSELYPEGFGTTVSVSRLGDHLCGSSRPGHFEGVATVCLKLFQISCADIAVFGEKDFQQLSIIKQMVTDLNLPLEVVAHPIVRESDGLAMSSRNRYLSEPERTLALSLSQALRKTQEFARSGSPKTAGALLDVAREALADDRIAVDYVSVASEDDLVPQEDNTPLSEISVPHLFMAVRIGSTRLIDNGPIGAGL